MPQSGPRPAQPRAAGDRAGRGTATHVEAAESFAGAGTTSLDSRRGRADQHEDIGTTANIYVQPNEACLDRKLGEIYEPGGADNDSARPL